MVSQEGWDPVMARRVSAFSDLVHLCQRQPVPKTATPALWRALSGRQRLNGSAVVATGCHARDVRAIEADVGQLAIAKLGQFGDVAPIVPERLDQSDKREQHGILLAFRIQPLQAVSLCLK